MTLKLISPRPGKTPHYYIRGTHCGVYVDETAGTTDRSKAHPYLKDKRDAIERGEAQSRKAMKQAPLFIDAALSYIDAGGDATYLGKYNPETGEFSKSLIRHFIDAKLADIDQAEIDAAAVILYPSGSPATRNRQVYTPMSAILKHAGIERSLRRPKGSQGRQTTLWLQPEQAFRMFDAAGALDTEFEIFLRFLCYTGCRLGDALNLPTSQILLGEGFAYLGKTKNDDPRGVHLPPDLVAALATHPRGLDRRGTVFRFRKNGHLYSLLKRVKKAAGPDVAFAGFHTFCHTWATWMRRYTGMDQRGLAGTGRWKDEKSVARYAHVVVSEESRKADHLPVHERKQKPVHGFSAGPRAELHLCSPETAEKASGDR